MRKYIDILNSCGADAWEISDIKTRGWEFYFIGHRLDQNRARDVEHIRLKVFKCSEDGTSMGFASAEISPTETPDGIEKTVRDLVYQASLVRNKPYSLNKPLACEPVRIETSSLDEEASSFIDTLKSISETDTEFINSYEIFVNSNRRRSLNSEGIDIEDNYNTSTLDLVVNARKGGHEIELYRLYEFGKCDPDQLRTDIEQLLKYGRDRLIAGPTPNLGEHSSIVLSTDAVLPVFTSFLDNLNAAFLVRGFSSFQIGKPLSESFRGDRITLRSVRELEGSPSNFACDEEGAPVLDAILMENGTPRKFIGGRMFSQYLGLEDSFSVTNWSVSGGSCDHESIRSGEFLEVVEFSDFQVDSITGDIFGEIRLAYYHDKEGNITPVSGGSVSGSMLDNISCMYMTRETRRYANAEVPAAIRLDNVTITGLE